MARSFAIQEGDKLWLPFFATVALASSAAVLAFSSTHRLHLFAMLLAAAALVQLVTQLCTGYALRACLIASYCRQTHPRLYWFHVTIAASCLGVFAYAALSLV